MGRFGSRDDDEYYEDSWDNGCIGGMASVNAERNEKRQLAKRLASDPDTKSVRYDDELARTPQGTLVLSRSHSFKGMSLKYGSLEAAMRPPNATWTSSNKGSVRNCA